MGKRCNMLISHYQQLIFCGHKNSCKNIPGNTCIVHKKIKEYLGLYEVAVLVGVLFLMYLNNGEVRYK